MAPNWTNEQLDAIEARNSNLLVAAAAGAGKTAVLVERIIRHLTEKNALGEFIDVDNLLVVTFTNAAAAEMRQRIAAALAKKLNEVSNNKPVDKEMVTHLNRQLALIGNASITTLHSFCLEIVRKYFYKLGLDPSFRIASENEVELLKIEVIEQLLEDLYSTEEENTEFLKLVDIYGGARSDEELIEMVLKLQNFARSMPWPEKWLREIPYTYKVDAEKGLDNLNWVQEILKIIKFDLTSALEKLQKAIMLANLPYGPSVYIDTFKKDVEIVENFARETKWEAMAAQIGVFEGFSNLKACRDKAVDDALKKQAQDLRNEAKAVIKKIREKYFVTSTEQVIKDLNSLVPAVEELVELTIDFDKAFTAAKMEKALVDFNDLEHYCLKILLAEECNPGEVIPSEVAQSLQQRFVEVLVDEYQDINPLQDIILGLVSRQANDYPNLFMVGDVKQSIYRFRLTEPQLFMDKYDQYPTTKGAKEYRIDLAANFRSRKSILDSVNFIFRQVMTRVVGEINYDAKAELAGGAAYEEDENTASPVVEIHIIDKKQDESLEEAAEESEADADAQSQEELDAAKLEARLLSLRIKNMVEGTGDRTGPEFNVFDKHINRYRPVTYKDIVILLRATSGWANSIMEEFRQAGIPCYAEVGSGYFEATEVETMLALLQVIDNPRQDISLAAVLRSPIVGLSASELSSVRIMDLKGDYYDALKAATVATENDIKLNFKLILNINTFLDRLERWRTAARQGPLTDLIWQIYRETGFYDYVGGMPGGAQRQANLRALYDRALEYEATTLRGLFRFLRFIEQIRDRGNDLGAARSLGENENVVRIMSIHKSKGLEFPVVILAGCGKGFNMRDINNKYLLHKKDGLGINVVDLDLRIAYPTLFKKALSQKIRMETLAEEMRLLYVALTRAREKLILVGTPSNQKKLIKHWAACATTSDWHLPAHEMAKAECYLHWLGAALIRHRNGQVIRELVEYTESLDEIVYADSSSWKVFLYTRNKITGPDSQQEPDDELLNKIKALEPISEPGPDYQKIAAWLSWKYDFEAFAKKPAKTAVTEIKRRFDPLASQEDESERKFTPVFSRPQFMQKKAGFTSAEQGSIMHLVMQHIDFTKPDICAVRQQIEAMIVKELLTAEQAATVNASKISEFLTSEIGERIRAAVNVKRELPFTMLIPAHIVHPDLKILESAEEKVLVQGVIDTLIEEDDGFVLLDYKTDRVNLNGSDEIITRYQGQLNLYAYAVEAILRKPVKKKLLYLFSLGKCLEIKGDVGGKDE